MLITGKKQQFLLYFLFITVIYLQFSYIISKQNNTVPTRRIGYSMNVMCSSEALCYPPNSSSFKRNQLRKLIVATMYNKSVYVNENDAAKVTYISQNYSTLAEFINNTREALMSRPLIPGTHSIKIIFHNPPFKDVVRPSCDGLWMEFGVFRGKTITRIANWKKTFCGGTSEPVYGFDTFSGLPSDWRPGYGRGSFDISNETLISVPSNVVLIKGLFIDTLPTQLRLIDRKYKCNTPVSFVHIDCDMYDGARDILFLLGSRLVSGSVLVFDELFNYPSYEQHEIKALFEFLAGFHLRLRPMGSSTNITVNPIFDTYTQSFAFVVDLEETM
jgi:hypothetical protein